MDFLHAESNLDSASFFVESSPVLLPLFNGFSPNSLCLPAHKSKTPRIQDDPVNGGKLAHR
jgi:hypothetical protein